MHILDPRDPADAYAAILNALPIVAYIARPDGTLTYLSPGWERLTGNRAGDVLASGYRDIVHPDDLTYVSANWQSAQARAAAYRDEFRLRFGDGSYRYVVSSADPIVEPGGAMTGWFGTITDIDDLRRTESALAQALQAASSSALAADERAHFTERLLDASDDCVKVLDLDARLISMSPNGQRALGITDFDAIAGSDWLQFWVGDDRGAAATAIERARAGGRGRFTGLYIEGGDTWWDVTVTPILDAAGRPEKLLAVSRDITEMELARRRLARSEERYRVLGDALPGVAWTATPDGLLDHISSPPNSNRPPVDARLGTGWLTFVHDDDREATRARWQASVDTGEPYDCSFRLRMADGTYRWQLVRALPQRDRGGAILRWVGVNIDVDEERRANEAREQFARLVEASSDVIAISDVAGDVTYVNEAGRSLLQIGSMEQARATRLLDFFIPNDRAFVQTQILPAIADDGRWLGEFRLRNFRTAAALPVLFTAFALFDERGRPAGIAMVSRDLRERLRVESGMRALAEAGAAMYVSLDFEGTVRNVAAAVTRSFASSCIVDALDVDGTIRVAAAAHRDPTVATALRRAATARNFAPDHPVARAIREGATTLVSSLPADWLDRYGIVAELGSEIDQLDVRSLIVVPIRSAQNGSTFGALTCVLDGHDPRGNYMTEDVRFAQEVAVRAGVALDHARAYERERRIAVTLQEASLPGVLPAARELRLSADYRPGNSEATIGGDWYDAFELDDGRIVITIGDVLGKGLSAAVTMGRLRQAMQSVALVLPDPNTMLDAADRTVRAQSSDTYATALAGIFDPQRREFCFASAGHPGPALRCADGSIGEFHSPGLLLGLRPRGETDTVTVAVPAGSMLAFFTDGLIESTRDVFEGHARLHAALTDAAVRTAFNPARALVEHVLDGRPATDDVAVLIAEIM